MVQRFDNDDDPKKKTKATPKEEVEKEETEDPENKFPVTPNYLDMILGNLIAIRLLLEKKEQA